MKKIDQLVKKVEYFEKLAVYSDRSTFLKRLAQAPQNASYQPYQGSTMVGDSSEPGPPLPEKTVIKYRADVLAAQKEFNRWNSFRPIVEDGKLGEKTKAAFLSDTPGGNLEKIIKDLSEAGMTLNITDVTLPQLPV